MDMLEKSYLTWLPCFLLTIFFSVIFPINFVCKWGKEILEQWVGYKGWGGVVANYEIASTFLCKSKKNFIKSEIISFELA